MVIALGPGKFYGSSLPRPRFYTDVKLNDERVDPPLPVNDALMTWANGAHWSMGGLNLTRHRYQGRIEGNVEKLRAQREKQFKAKFPKGKKTVKGVKNKNSRQFTESPSPPPAPVALKRRRVVGLVEEEEEEERLGVKRGAVRKLGDDFERVARESGLAVKNSCGADSGDSMVARRTRSKRDEPDQGKIEKAKGKLVKTAAAASVGRRSSPRLAKSYGGS